MRKFINSLIVACIMLPLLEGCSVSKNLLEHSKLKTESNLSSTIFLDSVPKKDKTIHLQIRNTSGKSQLAIRDKLINIVNAYGYVVMDDPNKAYFLLQANILKVDLINQNTQNELMGGYGSALEGGAIGALGGALSNNRVSPLVGGVGGAAVGLLADAMIKNVTYSVVTDIQISERSKSGAVSEMNNSLLKQGTGGYKQVTSVETSDWKRYQTTLLSTANKINLSLEEAAPFLSDSIAQSIGGIFG